ncbi:MAG: PilZ domain-containing protein [Deltaproteobacteria bacterium]|nr:PilZ domain-containing protein [Deltaproteobacteria bacterium]
MKKRSFLRMELPGISVEDIVKTGADTEVLDISAEGARIRTTKELKPGSIISFVLDLKDSGEQVSFLARVQWAKEEAGKHLVGLHFLK